MNNMRTLPVPGEFYRHFKNRLYQIVAIAYHSETSEPMVVYQALYGDYRIWVRPLAMFMEEVDYVKYPEAEQKFRFEKVVMNGSISAGNADIAERPGDVQKAEMTESACRADVENSGSRSRNQNPDGYGEVRPMSPYLLEFFDAMDEKRYDYMLEALAKLAEDATQKEIDDICLVLDMQTVGVSVEEQITEIRRHIRMLKKFDGERLR